MQTITFTHNKPVFLNKTKPLTKETAIKLFNENQIRTYLDDEHEKWYFSVQDVVQIFLESADVKQYIKKCIVEMLNSVSSGVQFVPPCM